MVKFPWPVPKLRFRNPFSSPVRLKALQKRFFSRGRKKITWRSVGKFALWTLGAILLVAIFLFAWFAKDLPTPGKIRNLVSSGSTRLFDRNMKPLYTISGEKRRILIEGKDIPDYVKQATVALEDRGFYQHQGVSPKSIFRAAIFDIQSGTKQQGGSTITQQFVKNALLTKDRNLIRKIKEAILAIELEFLFSKEEIMTMYLNEIPYGGSNYGIEAASRAFFNKSAKELTLDEAATLAALPQAPSSLSPYGQNVDRLITRRNYALDTMVELGYITKEDAEKAKAIQPHFAARHDSIAAPHFVLYVKDWLVDYFTEQLGDRQLAEQKVEEGGLSVVTTLDLDKQLMAEEVLRNANEKTLKRAGASNAGLVAIDPKRGEVVTMVGSVDYFQDQFGSFNVTTAKRQPGSSFKPVVYAASFKDKYNPAFTLFDLKTDFGKYVPENFDGGFRGPVTIRQALGNSLNIPAVKILALIGLEKALATAKDMGITTLTDKDRYGLSLVLGGGEVKPLEMATAYGVFANNGTLMPTTPVLKITDSKQRVIYDHSEPKDARQVLDPQVAYQITSILSDVEAKKPVFTRVMGTLTLNGRPVASKTGTTNGYRDAWTIGYTPQLATAVWAGNNDNSPMNRAGGSVAAAPLWDEFMEKAHKDLPVEDFKRPAEIKEVEVDRLSNKLPVDGSEVIKDIFATWQVPKDKDNVHRRVRVCRENGLLADESIPDELAEERVFRIVHSEMPDDPDWENPVIGWAKSNGYYNPPPSEKCQATSVKPGVQITSPVNNSTVSGVFTITAEGSAQSGIRSIEFLIDNVSIGVINAAPYSVTHDAKQLSAGSHSIGAVLTSNSGSVASTSITISVNKDTSPPGNVSNFTGVPGPGSGKVSLTWINPGDSDLKLVKIYVYLDSTLTLLRTVEVTPPEQNVVISSLTSGVAHRFIAKSVDTEGNESSGATVILTPP